MEDNLPAVYIEPPIDPPAENAELASLTRRRGWLECNKRLNNNTKTQILELIEEYGTIGKAAKMFGVALATLHRARKEDPHFERDIQQALQLHRDKIDLEVYKRAMEGWDEPVYFQGQVVGYVKKKSDKLLQFYAKRHIKEYRESDSSGSINVNAGGVLVLPAPTRTVEEFEKEYLNLPRKVEHEVVSVQEGKPQK